MAMTADQLAHKLLVGNGLHLPVLEFIGRNPAKFVPPTHVALQGLILDRASEMRNPGFTPPSARQTILLP
jgi:hypothetical protein